MMLNTSVKNLEKKESFFFGALVAFFLLYLLGTALFFPFEKQAFSVMALFDNGWIIAITEQILQGKKLYTEVAYVYGPIPIIVYLPFAKLFGNNPQTLFWVTGIIQVLNILLIYKLFRSLIRPNKSIIIILLIIFPTCFDLGISYTSYTPYEIMYLVGLGFIWRPYAERSWKRSILLGIYFIIPYFIKFGSHLIAGLVILILDTSYLLLRDNEKLKFRNYITHQLIVGASFGLSVSLLVFIVFFYLPKPMAIEFLWPMFMVTQYSDAFGYSPFPKYYNLGFFLGIQLPILVCLILGFFTLASTFLKKNNSLNWPLFIYPLFYLIASFVYLKNENYFYHYGWIPCIALPFLFNYSKKTQIAVLILLLPLIINKTRHIHNNIEKNFTQHYVKAATPSGDYLYFTKDQNESFLELSKIITKERANRQYTEDQNSLFVLDWGFGVAHYLDYEHATRHIFAIKHTIRPYEEELVSQQSIEKNFAILMAKKYIQPEQEFNDKALRAVMKNRLPFTDNYKDKIMSKVQDVIIVSDWIVFFIQPS